MGLRYLNGQETKPDLSQALKWFRLAAEQGHIEAKNMIFELSK
ncbi:MAG: SEL1-like repeat protein [Deltaproteobacteria bacterium]|nr:SEL1-like repeat protein [Deltaproteobacteria bacterium]